VSSSRDLEEEGRQARLEVKHRSKFNDERASRQPEAGVPTARNRRANPPHHHWHPPASRAKEDGWSETPRECPCIENSFL
jgi:hypothetical protein